MTKPIGDKDENYYPSSRRTRSEEAHSNQNKKHPKRKKVCAILLVIALLLVGGGVAYAYQMIHSTKTAIQKTYTKTSVKKLRNVSKILKQKKPFSVLILGTDTGALGRTYKGRTDTIIIATVNPKQNNATLTSIPRDTQVNVPDSQNSYDKINAAYTIGGPSTTIETIQNTLDIPIDYYLLVNMGGLRKIVDAVGGVTVDPLLTFKYDAVSVEKGKTVKLNGKQALSYARMRYDDPEGDYGRQKRQKQIITAIIKKALNISTLATRYDDILKSVEPNIQTDLTYDDMIAIATNYRSSGKKIDSYVLQGEDAMLDGASYQVATPGEKKKTSNNIRKHLGLEDSKKDFNDTINLSQYYYNNGITE